MSNPLPALIYEDLSSTRDRLRDVALVLSGLQRVYLPKHPRMWQYGLEVTMRGVSTQEFTVSGQPVRASIDMVRDMVRVPGTRHWPLVEYAGLEVYNNVRLWLEQHDPAATFKQPKFNGGQFDTRQASQYAEALWWMHARFRTIKQHLTDGVTSPILLYPHHFDLALTWFPHDDERQAGIGFSTGDATIREPYIYLTMYPHQPDFKKVTLPAEAYWQATGFEGAVLTYAALCNSPDPAELLLRFAIDGLAGAGKLLG
jgi:Family of unknown function (DUF5996)